MSYKCPGCQNEFPHLSVYLKHTSECESLKKMHEDFQYQTKDGLDSLTPSWANDFFIKKDPDFETLSAYIRVIKDLRLRKRGLCRKHGKDPLIGCPATCPNFDEAVPCDEPCALQYIIELLCDIAHDLINEEMK